MLLKECLILRREIGHERGAAVAVSNLGYLAFAQNNFLEAKALLEEGIRLGQEAGVQWLIPITLDNLGFLAFAQGDYIPARAHFDESLALCKEIDEKSEMAHALLGFGLVDLAEGKLEARKHILSSLHLCLETDEQLPKISSLIGAAGLVLQEGDAHFAAQLLGAVESALKALNAVVEVEVKFFYEGTLAQVKEALGEDAFQSAWEEGSQWSLDEAVKKVLGE